MDPAKGYRSISSPQILYPGTVDTFSYLNIGFFDTETEAINFRNYMTCKLPRFMMRTTYSSVHISKANFIFVPMLDFTQEWTDQKLYEFYGFTEPRLEQYADEYLEGASHFKDLSTPGDSFSALLSEMIKKNDNL